jgi:hypothetical protein
VQVQGHDHEISRNNMQSNAFLFTAAAVIFYHPSSNQEFFLQAAQFHKRIGKEV